MTIHVQAESPATCPALVLNADFRPLSYYPLSIWCWQDAIKAVFLDRVNIVSQYDTLVRSPSFEMRLPSVVSLKSYVKPSRFPAFTRFNVFLRDRFTCQYCGDRDDLTFDHVIPRSKGGVTSWENVVAACSVLQPEEGRPACPRWRGCGRRASPISRRCTTSIRTAGCSRPTTSTARGWTISTGIANWSLESGRGAGQALLAQLARPRASAAAKFPIPGDEIASPPSSFPKVREADAAAAGPHPRRAGNVRLMLYFHQIVILRLRSR